MDASDKHALQISVDQAKARLCLEVLRFVNRGDGTGESLLYHLALDHLIIHLGGDVDENDDPRMDNDLEDES